MYHESQKLEVQKFLENNSLDELANQFHLNVKHHEELPLVILNYDQIDSPRNHPISNECRGLILEKDSWEIVARSFNRFFNLGEYRNQDDEFEWQGSHAQDKEDGSLMTLFKYKDQFLWSTRGSFADKPVNVGCKPWSYYAWECVKPNAVPSVFDSFGVIENRLTLVFEFCSPYNKIVRRYAKPQLFLLTANDNWRMQEVEREIVDDVASELGVSRPKNHFFRDVEHVQAHLDEVSASDKTYEGVVVRDRTGKRLKIKSREYLVLHRLCNNGNIMSVKGLIPLLFDKDLEAEVLAYYPEVLKNYDELKLFYNGLKRRLENYWHCYHDEKNQKRFALAVKPCECNSLLFAARKSGWSLEEAIQSETGQKILSNYILERFKLCQ